VQDRPPRERARVTSSFAHREQALSSGRSPGLRLVVAVRGTVATSRVAFPGGCVWHPDPVAAGL